MEGSSLVSHCRWSLDLDFPPITTPKKLRSASKRQPWPMTVKNHYRRSSTIVPLDHLEKYEDEYEHTSYYFPDHGPPSHCSCKSSSVVSP